MTRAIVLLAVSVFATTAAAQSLPRYDVEAYCTKVAETVGGSSQIENTCINQEQSAYNGLKSKGDGLDAKALTYCDKVTSTVGGTYQILATCIEQETMAARSKPGFQY